MPGGSRSNAIRAIHSNEIPNVFGCQFIQSREAETVLMQTLTANLRSVSEQISDIGHTYPHSIALSYNDRQLSYEELDQRADRFAGHLVQLGIVSGGTVVICMERSFDWIIAALGVMRAGAAYVPLDPAWPDSRVRIAVEDSGATILIARASLLGRLAARMRGVDPCRDAAVINASPAVAQMSVQPDSLAYVIYTSGSTGVPKGVEITHANLSHLVRWHREAFGVTRRDRASHVAGLGFDAAVWEIWANLAAGATVCLADDAVRSSAELMQQWIIGKRITIAFVPTVYAAPMFEMEWPAATPLRLLLTGGDTLRRGPAARLPFEVFNNYGPTECTVVATSTLLKPGSLGSPPIGRPIAGTRVYLLNEHGEETSCGDTGEIYIGGNGVGRGYRNLHDSTERAFLPDPFAGTPGARMYRTGDRGIRRSDGEIEFRGRLDRQTKVRGQRVELDEIASILSQHPGIDFATVITNLRQGGEKQLVAYVLPRKNACVPSVHELQEHLLHSLPDYMIPEIFVRLHALPLSPNEKVDLAMLEEPTDLNLLERTTGEVPAWPIEDKVLKIVQALLKNDAVRAEDSFFLAGGHSLLGTQLVMRLRTVFGVDVTLRQLFEAPTVRQLAILVSTLLEEGTRAAPSALRPPVKFAARKATVRAVLPEGVFELQPHGTRNSIFWAHYQSVNLAKAIGVDQPFLSVSLTARDVALLGEKPTLQEIAACHLRKILATQSKGPYTIGGQCVGGILAYEIASQLQAAGQKVSLLVLLDAQNPSYPESCDSPALKLNYLRYSLKRATRLGLRLSLVYLRARLVKRFTGTPKTTSVRAEMEVAQKMVEAAASAYRPTKYDGDVLLLLASDRPPHVNYLPGWQTVIPRNLHIQYVDGHHRDLLNARNAPTVAHAIVSRIIQSTEDSPVSGYADAAG
jgi:amino acid adenylation domain-containing protein